MTGMRVKRLVRVAAMGRQAKERAKCDGYSPVWTWAE
jgi:hypothetical protein